MDAAVVGRKLSEQAGRALQGTHGELDWGAAMALIDGVNAAPVAGVVGPVLHEVRRGIVAGRQRQQALAVELLDALVKNCPACAAAVGADGEWRRAIGALLLQSGKAAAASRPARELLLRCVAQWGEAAARDAAMRPFAALHAELLTHGVEFPPAAGPNPLLAPLIKQQASALPQLQQQQPQPQLPAAVDFTAAGQDVARMDAVVAMGVPNAALAAGLAARLQGWNECVARSLADERVLANEQLLARTLDLNGHVLRVLSAYQAALANPQQRQRSVTAAELPPPPSYATVEADRAAFVLPQQQQQQQQQTADQTAAAEPPPPVRFELGSRFAPAKLAFDQPEQESAPTVEAEQRVFRPAPFDLEQSYAELFGSQPP